MERNGPKSGSQQPLLPSSETSPRSASGALKNADRSLFRRLATNPVFLSTALAIGGMIGIKPVDSAKAQFNPHAESAGESVPIIPNAETFAFYEGQLSPRLDKSDKTEKKDDYPDIADVKLMEFAEPEKSLFDQIQAVLGPDVHMGQPENPADVRKWVEYKVAEKKNVPLDKNQLSEALIGIQKMPKSMNKPSELDPTGSWPEIWYMTNGELCTCGLNGYELSKNKSINLMLITNQYDYGDMRRSVENHPYIDTFSGHTQYIVTHEVSHSVANKNPMLFARYIHIAGWVEYNGKWTTKEPKDLLPTIDNDFRRTPYEAFPDMVGYTAVNPKVYLLLPHSHQLFLALEPFFADWSVWEDEEVKAKRDEILAQYYANPSTPTPTSSPTPTNTPRPSATPTETEAPYETPTPKPSKTPTSRPSATPWMQTRVPNTPTPTKIGQPIPSDTPTPEEINRYDLTNQIFLPFAGRGADIKLPPDTRRESIAPVLEPGSVHAVGQMVFVMLPSPIA